MVCVCVCLCAYVCVYVCVCTLRTEVGGQAIINVDVVGNSSCFRTIGVHKKDTNKTGLAQIGQIETSCLVYVLGR